MIVFQICDHHFQIISENCRSLMKITMSFTTFSDVHRAFSRCPNRLSQKRGWSTFLEPSWRYFFSSYVKSAVLFYKKVPPSERTFQKVPSGKKVPPGGGIFFFFFLKKVKNTATKKKVPPPSPFGTEQHVPDCSGKKAECQMAE